MRVTFEHRERISGLTGGRRDYYLDCTVVFSEEERAIIHARRLYEHFIEIDKSSPPPTLHEYMAAGISQAFAPLVTVIGISLLIYAIYDKLSGGRTDTTALAVILMIAGPIMWAVGYVQDRRMQYWFKEPAQRVSIRLMQQSSFEVYASAPAYANVAEDDVREKLGNLKSLIMQSAELGSRKAFEL